jgi:hypothetical protein
MIIFLSIFITSCAGSNISKEISNDTNLEADISDSLHESNINNNIDKEMNNDIKDGGNVTNNLSNCKLTTDDIKKMYDNENKIVSITEFENQYVLVESKRDSSANKFELYNLSTGDRDELPTMPLYVKLIKIVSENEIILFATGENSESSSKGYPHIINCIRTSENINSDQDFKSSDEEYFFEVGESCNFGDAKSAEITKVEVNKDSIIITFGPIPGDESGFYPDFMYFPITNIEFENNNQQVVIVNQNAQISDTLLHSNVESTKCQFINDLQLMNEIDNSKIIINLKSNAKQYTVKTRENNFDSQENKNTLDMIVTFK